MSRRTDGRGPTLVDALRDALADLLDTDADDIVLKVDAPGVDELTGRLALELDVVPPERPEAEVRTEVTAETTHGRGAGRGSRRRRRLPRGTARRDGPPGRSPKIRVHEDHAEVEILEIGSGALIGRRGQTLEAVQELLRCALQREFQRRCRIKVDAEGYRARRLEKLVEKAEEAIDEVLDNGESVRLEPMDVFERKAVHQLVDGPGRGRSAGARVASRRAASSSSSSDERPSAPPTRTRASARVRRVRPGGRRRAGRIVGWPAPPPAAPRFHVELRAGDPRGGGGERCLPALTCRNALRSRLARGSCAPGTCGYVAWHSVAAHERSALTAKRKAHAVRPR
jgi:spoIIIJ-associated protein